MPRRGKPLLPKWRYWPAAPLAALIVFAVFGDSFGDPPGGPPNQKQQAGSEQHQSNPPINNDGTFLFAVGTWAEANHNAIEALSALGTLVFTVALFGATAILAFATRNLATATAGLRDAEREQAAELRKATDLAEKQFLMAGRQANLAEKQHGLQRLQYLAEHRPRIVIRSVGITPPTPNGPLFQAGHFIKGSLVIVNAGASDATIRQAEYRFYWATSSLPMVPPLQQGSVKPLLANLPHKMAGHESCLVTIESDAAAGPEARLILLSSGVYLYVMGAILYSDWDLTERWMGFCRQYTLPAIAGSEGSFTAVNNPDYEYED